MREKSFYQLDGAGTITGLEVRRQGLGLDVKPGIVARWRELDSGETETEFEPSLDLFYRITPSLTGTLTFNTDFAEPTIAPALSSPA